MDFQIHSTVWEMSGTRVSTGRSRMLFSTTPLPAYYDRLQESVSIQNGRYWQLSEDLWEPSVG